MTETPTPGRVLVIMAHPDDPEFSAGGTIARWTSEGHEVVYALVTDGSKGTDDRDLTPQQLVALRREEQTAAARELGVHHIIFMDYPDGEVVPDLALRRDLVRVMRRVQPEIIVAPDPHTLFTTFGTINHPDHRAVGLAAMDAIFPAARNHNYFPELLAEGLEPVYVKEVYLSGTLHADTWIDVTATFERKLQALRAHKSQIADMDGLARRMRERMKQPDSPAEQPTYVEAFRHLNL